MDFPNKDGIENRNWDSLERRAVPERRSTRRSSSHGRRSRRSRWREFKKAVKSLLIIMGICFVVALLITYLTVGFPSLVERTVSNSLEKAIKNTTGGFVDGGLNNETLRNLTKNIDINKLKDYGSRDRNAGRSEGQSLDDYRSHTEYSKQMPDESLENLKRKYKEKLGR